MTNFTQRAITGTGFVIVLIASISWNFYSFAILFLLLTLLGLHEFYQLAAKSNVKPQKIAGILTGSVVFLSFACSALSSSYALLALPLPLLFLVFILELFTSADKPFHNIAYTLLGIVYIALPFSLWNLLVYPSPSGPYSCHLLLGYFFIIWTNDTGAYFAGMALGKTKLFERISPKKTWEGAIGGGLLSLVVAGVISMYFKELELKDWLIIAVLIVVTGSLGDLVESLFKRSIQVKDSGSILPGHGGILDRFDAVLVSSPFVFTYVFLVRHF